MRKSAPLVIKLLAAVLAITATINSRAATYVVNTTDVDLPDTNTALAGCDANPMVSGDQCTLRAAVMQANAQPGADTIVLPLNTTITLTISGNGDASMGDLDITAPVTITSIVLGAPADASDYPLIVANHSHRFFRVANNANVTLRGMRLQGGTPPGLEFGGALGTLAGTQTLVDRVRFEDNGAYAGGAIATWGIVTVEDSDFVGNSAGGGGAAIYDEGIVTVRRSSLRESNVSQPNHSAVYVADGGWLTMENTLIDGSDPGGSLYDTAGIYAIHPTSLIVRNSTLVDFDYRAIDVIANNSTSVRVYNTVALGDDSNDCAIVAEAGTSPDVIVDYSMLRASSDCDGYRDNFVYQASGPDSAGLAALASPLDSFIYYRRPLLNSQLVDIGTPEGMAGEPGLACLATDQIGNMRPQDGDANGSARCDIGAIEAATQYSSTYTVNWFTQDLPDSNPGDDVCDADLFTLGDQCTLRAAVMEANAKPGPDIIEFVRDDGNDNTLQLTRSGAGGALWGDLDITEQISINGNAENGRPLTRIVGAMSDRLFDLSLPTGHIAVFNDLSLSGGETTGYGGAIRGLSGQQFYVQSSEVIGNCATLGGGALYAQGINMSVIRSDLHHNSAPTDGAAILARASLFVVTSSLWSNTTADAGQPEVIYIDDNGSHLHRISNSTVSGNSGGVLADQTLQLQVRSSTIVDNGDYGLRTTNGGGVKMSGSILAGNGTADCSLAGGTALDANAYNLIEDASCALGGTNVHAAPLLTPALWRPDFAVSRAHRPMPGSPAIDAIPQGDDVFDPCPSWGSDQFGSDRSEDSNGDGIVACEMGAVEMPDNAELPAEFLVNVVDKDAVDANPGDGSCDINLGTPGQQCTLRAAVMESNLLLGNNYVSFETPGSTVVLSRPASGLLNDASTGDLDVLDGISIEGFHATPASRPHLLASHGDRIFNVNAPSGVFDLSDVVLSGGATTGSGGAIRVVNASHTLLLRTRMEANSAGQGGGALSLLAGIALLDRVDLDNNGVVGNGAAIRSEADLTIHRSSIRNNLDFDAAGSRQAIHAQGGHLTEIYNSTISGNTGMGVDVADGTLRVENSTLADNSGWGLRFEKVAGETLYLRHDLLNGNGSGGCQANGAGAATISTNGYNISQSYGCDIQSGAGNLITGDINLLPLASFPETFTAFHLLGPGSPAIDFGSLTTDGVAGCEEYDQDYLPRPLDGDGDGSARCDAGAIEMVAWPDTIFRDGLED